MNAGTTETIRTTSEGKADLKSMLPQELEQYMASVGQPPYRANQVFRWLSQGITDFDQMSDLPKSLRETLAQTADLGGPRIARKQVSKRDGTVKYLFGLADGNCVETVVMQYAHGNSVCLSTQAGCHMGCAFCASFEKGETRNLTPAEILDQVIFAGLDSGLSISNIVLMGTGEPLDNYDNVIQFLSLVGHERGLRIGMRHISLSTCGLVPRIYDLAALKLQLTLSVSLHAPTDEIRSQIMPINNKYPLAQLIRACRDYFETTGRRISFEYAMIAGLNDGRDCAQALCGLLRGLPCHINLIPLNHVGGSPLKPSGRETVRRFQQYLQGRGFNATVRRSLGGDIDASCGQLRRKAMAGKKD